ncbi:unnamed protein product [Anisakis simplex]|uniref:Chal_sti_synt_N domain-containing protein n=1 Tax=Anisakis simplex TaxID=6269 RepID=A0A0M3JGV4_ANISI|nr:unnamed protein product [Anisakis simplex]
MCHRSQQVLRPQEPHFCPQRQPQVAIFTGLAAPHRFNPQLWPHQQQQQQHRNDKRMLSSDDRKFADWISTEKFRNPVGVLCAGGMLKVAKRCDWIPSELKFRLNVVTECCLQLI